jgi:hypothetical protein
MVTRRAVLQGVGGGAIALSVARFSGFTALAQDSYGTPAAGGAYPTVAYTAKEYAFDGPATFAGGLTEVSLTNNGTMTHHGMFMLLNEGKTIADLGAAAAKNGIAGLLSVAVSVGGPASIDPGLSTSVVIDFKPGNYVLVCVIPDADGVPHMAKGMALPITVTAAPATQPAAPTADLAVELADFKFVNLPAATKAGKQIWAVSNKGAQVHELAIFKLAEGVSAEQAIAMMSASEATPMPGMEGTPETAASPAAAPSGPPPLVDVAGFAPVSPGYSGWALLDLEAGNYLALCFVPDTATGKPHFMLGMEMGFTAA